MIWKLFRPKPIVVIELPFEGTMDQKLSEKIIETLIEPLKKDYHVIFKFTDKLSQFNVEVHNK